MNKDVIAVILHQVFDLSMIIGFVLGILNIIVNNTKAPKYRINFEIFILLSIIFGITAGLNNDNFYLGMLAGIVSFLSLIFSCYLVILVKGIVDIIRPSFRSLLKSLH